MRVRVGDVRLFFDVEGAGLAVEGPVMRERPALVLLPGGPGFDHTVFRPSFSPLADVAQVIYLDLRGHGRSGRGDPACWTVEVWADDVRGFCDAVGIEHPVVLGWSFGGMVAMAYAIRHPAKLVLQSAMARLDIDRVAEGFRRIGGEQAATVARTFWSAGAPEALAAYGRVCAPLYGPSQPDPDQAARALFNLDLLSNPGSAMRGVNLLSGLSSVTCPDAGRRRRPRPDVRGRHRQRNRRRATWSPHALRAVRRRRPPHPPRQTRPLLHTPARLPRRASSHRGHRSGGT